MRSQSLLIVALVFVVVLVMSIVIFLPSTSVKTTSPHSKSSQLQTNQNKTSSTMDGEKDSPQTSQHASSREGLNPSNDATIQDGTFITTEDGSIISASSSNIRDTTSLSPPPSVIPGLADKSNTSPTSISGVVTDNSDAPLNGVAIQINGKPFAVSALSGEFKAENIPQKVVTVTAILAGYQSAKREGVARGTTNLKLVMIPEGVLAGRVQDQFGDPIALAQVQARAMKGIWVVDSNADAEGRFQFENAPSSSIRLQARQEGFSDAGAGTKVVESPFNHEFILRLDRPTFSISGRVLDRDTQQGISGFKLSAVLQSSPSASEKKIAETDAAGMYRFDQLKQGAYTLSSMPKENAHLNYVIPLKEDFKSVRLFEKSLSQIDFLATRGKSVNGTVVTSNGQPVSNAEVKIAGLDSVQTFSGQDGRFFLTNVPITGGQTLDRFVVRLMASHPEYGTGLSDPLPSEIDNAISGITITLQGLTQLSGKVIDRSGTPLSDVHITLRDLSTGDVRETFSDAGGAFTFERVSLSSALNPFAGTHEIIAEKEAYSTIRQQIMFQASSQQTITVTMEQGGFIDGRVTDLNGQSLAGVSVSTLLPYGGQTTTRTDAAGLYHLTGLPEGAYDLHFRVDADPPLTGVLYQIAVGSEGADIALSPGKWDVMGTVFDQVSGQQIFQYLLSVEGVPRNPRGKPFIQTQPVNTPDGTYLLTFTEPGIYRIRFLASGYHPLEEKADISPGTMRVQYINPKLKPLESTGQIQGTFTGSDQMALAGINIPGVQAFPTTGNAFVLEGIPAGNHDLIFHVYDRTSGAIYELGVLRNISVVENNVTDIGQITPQIIQVHSRNF